MFKRRWFGLGGIRSDEGFKVSYSHKTVNYSDGRGEYQIGYEDGLLIPDSLRVIKQTREIREEEKSLILRRILSALEWDGHTPRIWIVPGE